MSPFIPEDKVAELKQTVDIVDVVGQYVLLKKTGSNFIGLCPFHTEKTPSFTVSPQKQIFHCFGCGSGGDVFGFIMKQEGLTFPESVRLLANRYSISLPEKKLSPGQKKKQSEKEKILAANQVALNFFLRSLTSDLGSQKARTYLNKRGITDDLREQFKLGYAPAGWDHLQKWLYRYKITPTVAQMAGLVIPRKNSNGHYDRFRDRIIFPIFDLGQRVIGFGGRVLDDSMPKYLNSPETPVYHKGRSLYGLPQARRACREKGTVFIVEGYLDMIALFRHGVTNAVATLGTALTQQHVRLLKGFADNMILVYDSDQAGIKAAHRCVDIFWESHIDFRKGDVYKESHSDTRILVLPEGHDPDSYLGEFGGDAFLNAASKAPGVITFLLDSTVAKHGLSTQGKVRIMDEMQGALARINDSVARSLYIKKIAERLDIDENAVLEKIRQGATKPLGPVAGKIGSPRGFDAESNARDDYCNLQPLQVDKLEREIVVMMLQFPEFISEIRSSDIVEKFENTDLRTICRIILQQPDQSDWAVSDLLDQLQDERLKSTVSALSLREHASGSDALWTQKGCRRLLHQFEERCRRKETELLKRIQAAEENNDQNLLLNLLKEKQALARKRQ